MWSSKHTKHFQANSEDYDQAPQIHRSLWVFAGRTCILVGNVLAQLGPDCTDLFLDQFEQNLWCFPFRVPDMYLTPAGTQRWHNVDATLIQCQDVESTLNRPLFQRCVPAGTLSTLSIFFSRRHYEIILWFSDTLTCYLTLSTLGHFFSRRHFELDHEVSICSLIPPAMAISIARTTKGNNSKEPGPMALIFFPTIQLVILVMCTKFQVSR